MRNKKQKWKTKAKQSQKWKTRNKSEKQELSES